ncbi:hypothetical protein HMI59_24115 (plasmid) [Paenarthrobacter sp. YJN-5]|nr:hypothetical protein HMI59_24115 [Paenarthrobacter sp. YJN-5]
MKRQELMKKLARVAKERGEELTLKEGGNHTKVQIGTARTVVPRHREIDNELAKEIMKQIGEKR